MQMLVIIFRNSWESEVLGVLRACHVASFTDVTEVLGAGESGLALHTVTRPGFNSMVLTALPDPDADRLAEALRRLRDDAVAQQHGSPVPLRVFALPCTLVV